MRGSVEEAVTVERPEDEAIDRLGPDVARLLRRGEGVAPGEAPDPLHGEHPPGRELRYHLGHLDERMAAIERQEALLVRALAAVVELFPETGADLLYQRPRIEVRERQAQHAIKEVDVADVGGHRVGDARILYLHDHVATVVGAGAVDLPDRGGGERLGIKMGEGASRWPAELLLDDARRELERHGRGRLLEPREHLPV